VSEAPARSGWLPGIETLRAVAALTVVLHHCWSLSNQPHFTGYQIVEGFGSWGVGLFFLLSGYLLGEWFWRPRGTGHTRSFYVRRFARIAPAYYLNVAFLFLFFAQHALLFSPQGVKQVVANATFTQFLFPNTSSNLNVNGALWTLTIEMILYLAMPFMARAVARRPWGATVGMVGIGLGWLLMVALAGDRIMSVYFPADRLEDPAARLFVARQFPGQLPLFAVGLLVRWLIVNGRLPERWVRRERVSLGVIGLLLVPSIFWLFFVERSSDYHRWVWFTTWNFVLILLFVPVLIYTSSPVQRIGPVMGVSQWLGERSYGIYLWHFPIVLAVYGMGPLLYPPPSTYMLARVALIMVLAIVAGAISFAAVEDPARRYGQGIAGRLLGGPARATRAALK
jgi:peptidoglycan/LPS O-acetylase OafA/YrhL